MLIKHNLALRKNDSCTWCCLFTFYDSIWEVMRIPKGKFQLKDAKRIEGQCHVYFEGECCWCKKNICGNNHQVDETLRLKFNDNFILKDFLHVTKLCYLWVPHILTEGQKTLSAKWCWWTLKIHRYVNNITRDDGTRLYYYDVSAKYKNKMMIHLSLSENYDLQRRK